MDNKAENSLALAVALLPKPDKRRLNGAMGRPHKFFAPTFISDWLDYIITIKFVRKLSRKVQLLAQTAPYLAAGLHWTRSGVYRSPQIPYLAVGPRRRDEQGMYWKGEEVRQERRRKKGGRKCGEGEGSFAPQ